MSNDFGALTILAPKCQKCPKVETCDHKQLAHLGYIIPIEDITGTHTDPYHYKLYFHTDILPDVEVRS